MSDSLLRDWCKGVLAGDDSFRFATGFDADVRLARAVATRLLELLPVAGDDEPITDLWLNSLSGHGWDHKGHTIDIGPLEFEPHAFESGGPVTLHADTPRVKRILSTRGCVRRLAAALGITLKEPK